ARAVAARARSAGGGRAGPAAAPQDEDKKIERARRRAAATPPLLPAEFPAGSRRARKLRLVPAGAQTGAPAAGYDDDEVYGRAVGPRAVRREPRTADPHIGAAARRCWRLPRAALRETQAPIWRQFGSETADPAHRPPRPSGPSSHAAEIRRRATAAASLERRWRGRRQTASPDTASAAASHQDGRRHEPDIRGQPAENQRSCQVDEPGRLRPGVRGANEGLYYMSLDQLHDPTMVLLVRQRCLWLFVYRASWCPSLAGTLSSTGTIWHSYFLPMPSLIGCMRVSAAKHPETAEALAGLRPAAVRAAAPVGQRQRTFLEFKSLPCPDLPQPLLTFELLIRSGFKLPFVCVGVLRGPERRLCPVSPADLNKLDGQIELSPNDETALDEEVE
uniref:DNA_pol_B_exo1 domain-containing protein n=1 Tax=Macrostomum lignano TaxID=282301 RepID=A0A1I8FLV0_9PLAT